MFELNQFEVRVTELIFSLVCPLSAVVTMMMMCVYISLISGRDNNNNSEALQCKIELFGWEITSHFSSFIVI